MHRLLIGTLALAMLLGSSICADDEKKKEEKSATPEAMFKELVGKYRAATKQEERQELLKSYSKKFLDYAETNAKAADAPEALFYVLQLPLQGKDSPKSKAVAMLKKDFTKSPTIGKHLKRFQVNPDDGDAQDFVKGVYDENPDKTARAYAAKALIKVHEQAVALAERLKDKEVREKFEKARGENAVKKILALAENAPKEIKGYNDKLTGELKGVFLDLSVGAAAPEHVSQDLEGKKVKLSDLKGKVVVLDIWATWCPPCRAMIPHTRELVKKMDGKPFAFVSISADDKKDTVTEFIKKTPMPWTHWWNGATGGIVEAWDVEYYPTIYVLDHKGVIRFKDLRDKKLDEAVVELVKEAEGGKKDKSE